jgi:hypothetical protein
LNAVNRVNLFAIDTIQLILWSLWSQWPLIYNFCTRFSLFATIHVVLFTIKPFKINLFKVTFERKETFVLNNSTTVRYFQASLLVCESLLLVRIRKAKAVNKFLIYLLTLLPFDSLSQTGFNLTQPRKKQIFVSSDEGNLPLSFLFVKRTCSPTFFCLQFHCFCLWNCFGWDLFAPIISIQELKYVPRSSYWIRYFHLLDITISLRGQRRRPS